MFVWLKHKFDYFLYKYNFATFLLISSIITCNIASAATSMANYANKDFSFYVFSVFYGPSQCEDYTDCSLLPNINEKFIAHGLWPHAKNGDPVTDCSDIPLDITKFDPVLLEQLKTAFANNFNLMKHEWEKHGTCTNLDQTTYFKQVLLYFNNMQVSSLIILNSGGKLTYPDLVKSYNTTEKHIFFLCNYDQISQKQFLQEVLTTWSSTGVSIEPDSFKSKTCNKDRPIYIPKYIL